VHDWSDKAVSAGADKTRTTRRWQEALGAGKTHTALARHTRRRQDTHGAGKTHTAPTRHTRRWQDALGARKTLGNTHTATHALQDTHTARHTQQDTHGAGKTHTARHTRKHTHGQTHTASHTRQGTHGNTHTATPTQQQAIILRNKGGESKKEKLIATEFLFGARSQSVQAPATSTKIEKKSKKNLQQLSFCVVPETSQRRRFHLR